MTKIVNSGQKYRVFIFVDDEASKNLLLKFARNRGYEVSVFSYPEACDAVSGPDCKCAKVNRCADIMVLGRHFSSLKALDLLENQSRAGCRLSIKNKLLIFSTYDEEEAERGKALGVKMLHMPFAFKELNDWFDECEERLKLMG